MSGTEAPPGQVVRDLMRRAGQVGLATALAHDAGARPYISLALVALDHDASPLLLLSDLAEHSRNIAADPRLALLFDGTAGWPDPLAGPRASVLGRAETTGSPRLLARFTARHPGAKAYGGFADFKLYRVAVERAHLVAGFGRVHWSEGREVLFDMTGTEPLAAAEAEILDYLNRTQREAVPLIATQILGLENSGWVAVGVDPEGCDLRREGVLARAAFARPVRDAESARAELRHLITRARRLAADRTR